MNPLADERGGAAGIQGHGGAAPAAGGPAAAGADGARAGGAGGPVDWVLVRQAFEARKETLARIRERFGLTIAQLRSRRKLEGWRARPQIARRGLKCGGRPKNAEQLTLRLQQIMKRQLAALDRRLANGGELQDRDARNILQMARALDIMAKTGDAKKNSGTDNGRTNKSGGAEAAGTRLDGTRTDGGADRADHVAWMRDELTRRLARAEETGERERTD